MTIKSKTFYVNKETIKYIKDFPEKPYQYTGMMSFLNKCQYGDNTCEITISWKEERKAEVTESQIDKMVKELRAKDYPVDISIYLKEQIFKDVK